MSRQPKLRPKSHIPGFPDAIYNLAAVSSLSQLESRAGLGEEKHDQRVFRVKRKHVLKACDRCRVKKTKVGEVLGSSMSSFASILASVQSLVASHTHSW